MKATVRSEDKGGYERLEPVAPWERTFKAERTENKKSFLPSVFKEHLRGCCGGVVEPRREGTGRGGEGREKEGRGGKGRLRERIEPGTRL
jgi:hypothetical protein